MYLTVVAAPAPAPSYTQFPPGMRPGLPTFGPAPSFTPTIQVSLNCIHYLTMYEYIVFFTS